MNGSGRDWKKEKTSIMLFKRHEARILFGVLHVAAVSMLTIFLYLVGRVYPSQRSA